MLLIDPYFAGFDRTALIMDDSGAVGPPNYLKKDTISLSIGKMPCFLVFYLFAAGYAIRICEITRKVKGLEHAPVILVSVWSLQNVECRSTDAQKFGIPIIRPLTKINWGRQ